MKLWMDGDACVSRVDVCELYRDEIIKYSRVEVFARSLLFCHSIFESILLLRTTLYLV